MENQSNNSMQQEVLAAIKDRGVVMRPRWQFILSGTLAVLGGVIIGLALLYVMSLAIFMLRENGAAAAPMFGARGIFTFLRSLPWLMLFLSLVFVIILEFMVRRFSFAYRRPLLYSAGGIMLLVLFGGMLVSGSSLHYHLFARANDHRLPFGEGVYRDIDLPPPGVYRGVIQATTTNGFVIQNRRGETIVVSVGEETEQTEHDLLKLGLPVVVFGDPASGTINAYGIRFLK